jgi:hypothetical protein
MGAEYITKQSNMNMSKWIEASASNHDTINYSALRIWLQSMITSNISIIKNILKRIKITLYMDV